MKPEEIIITIGDPAGCGPLVALKAVKDLLGSSSAHFIIVGDEKILSRIDIYRKVKKSIIVVDLATPGIDKVKIGSISKLSGSASLCYLDKALQLMKEKNIKRLVTAPLSKEAVSLNLPGFSGHSEYLADFFKCRIEMMMFSQKIKTVLFTRHISFKNVPGLIKESELIKTFDIVLASLREMFMMKNPKIAVTSLNPHAGVNTFFGKEEMVIDKAVRRRSRNFFGPYPSDSIFIEENIKKYDCIISLYHDQGMVPFKLLSMKEGVNLTLGLPIIRTSPAHGVAFDVMQQGKTPFSSSMAEAIKLAARLKV